LTRARSWGRALALLAVTALALTACTGGGGERADPTASTATPLTLSYATAQEFVSYNNNTAADTGNENSAVLDQVLRGFWYASPLGQLVPDTEFGTYERLSSNPLTVRYTFDPRSQWSDGVPLDCSDAVLAWAVYSGRWPTRRRDPTTGARIGTFAAARPGAWSNVEAPQCSAGDRSFTITYTSVYADWQSLFGPGTILPAHVVEKRSGVPDVIAAVRADDVKAITRIANTYDTLWHTPAGHYDRATSPSDGPYQVAGWDAGRSLTLKANPDWWGTPPKAATVVVRFLAENRQVAALKDGDVQVIDPTPTTAITKQLQAAGPAATVTTADSFTWEHLDFNFRGEFRTAALREAFAKCVPRQQIVDTLVKPLNPDAGIQQSRFLLPFQPGYSKLAAAGGGEAYDTVDLAGAKRLLETRDKLGAKVRIGYQSPDPERKAEVEEIRQSCDQAGFKVIDDSSPDFFAGDYRTGRFDVALFAWNGTPLITQYYSTYISRGAQNKGHYSSPEVDLLLRQLYSELDSGRQQQLVTQLDTTLWSDLATIPLFVHPAVLATAPDVTGVDYNPNADGVTYDLQDWDVGPSS
jgi:peptide/nickel transport system substrate-binding protein